MSETLSPALPDSLYRLLDGSDLESKVGETLELLTVGPEGWPHVALLSVGEVLAVAPAEIRLALWPSSQTTANLLRTGQATLTSVRPEGACYVWLLAAPLDAGLELATFRCSVQRLVLDRVDYADLTHGISFTLRDPSAVVARWEGVIAALRAAA
jgi:hypothetical protein